MMTTSGNNDPPAGEGDMNASHHNSWRIQSIHHDLLNSPIDFIFAEHNRQRQSAIILSMIADGEFDKAGVTALIEFLETDFALHIGDEEVVLFPVLRQHCCPEDNIDRIIQRLQDEHRADEACVDDVLKILKRRLTGRQLAANEALQLRLFADHIREHLALENGVILPIARIRLGAAPLEILTEMLQQRHSY